MSEARHSMKRRSFLGGLLSALTLGRLPPRVIRSTAEGTLVPAWNPSLEATWSVRDHLDPRWAVADSFACRWDTGRKCWVIEGPWSSIDHALIRA